MFSSHVFGERLNCLVYLSYSALFVLSCWFTGTFTVPDVLFFVFVCLFVCLIVCFVLFVLFCLFVCLFVCFVLFLFCFVLVRFGFVCLFVCLFVRFATN